MLRFTSALYLGLRHEHPQLPPWRTLTTGRPAALAEDASAALAAERLATLQGVEQATLGTSTLHLLWDLFGLLAENGASFFMDRGLYPIARWGLERAAGRGAAVRSFRHFDPAGLEQALARSVRLGRRPVVVTDGLCTRCGRAAPLRAYQHLARRWGGRVVVDDTQALGILGARPSRAAPYGQGGGGILRWSATSGPDMIVVASLAKGFGAPLAALSAGRDLIQRFRETSDTRVFCSPPSAASIGAAARALALNEREGDARRERLAALVSRFRAGARGAGLPMTGGTFPVQAIAFESRAAATRFHQRLRKAGVEALLQPGDGGFAARIGFLLTAGHRERDIDRAVAALRYCVDATTRPRRFTFANGGPA